ncbi:serine--tRNA ligase [Oleispirillum naphthae]|uniref:serine--tRNA ligase n=1 Tax=Oleispirillum naphthae TaxID=2838853 RepID=UPI0030824300
MLDIRMIRDNPGFLDAALARRGKPAMAEAVLTLDRERRALQTAWQEMQARRNEASRQVGAVKKAGGDAAALIDEVAALKQRMAETEEAEKRKAADLESLLLGIPNAPADDVPEGPDEDSNVERSRIGTPRGFGFAPLEHDAIGEKLGLMSFDDAAKLSGARFVVLRGGLARLERALGQFMLDLHTAEHGYEEISPPVLVRDAAVRGTGQLPKFSEDLFRTENGFWLIPTAEVPLTNLVAETILEEKDLPKRFTALTACFRSEAGAAGKDTRGMIRQHQFYKVEMVSITAPEASDDEQRRMLGCAETVLKRLELPYRVVALCAGDMGATACRTFDIEVWLPGQNRYREISSCSTCGDYQARRMNARYRPAAEAKGTRFVHTLNGSGVAVGRALVAVLENYQQADGSVVVPDVLRPYMGGLPVLKRNA